MASTANQLALVTELREAMEKELVRHLQDNLNNRLTEAVGTGIFHFVSTAAEGVINQMQQREPKGVHSATGSTDEKGEGDVQV